MINRISLQNITSYPKLTPTTIEVSEKRVNLFYGLNGSGKSTIGKYFQDLTNEDYADCSIIPIPTQDNILVYNQDFVESNFYESESQQGIFTIGEIDANAEKEIEEVLEEIQALETTINNITDEGITKSKDLDKLDNDIKDVIWKRKTEFKNHPLFFV